MLRKKKKKKIQRLESREQRERAHISRLLAEVNKVRCCLLNAAICYRKTNVLTPTNSQKKTRNFLRFLSNRKTRKKKPCKSKLSTPQVLLARCIYPWSYSTRTKQNRTHTHGSIVPSCTDTPDSDTLDHVDGTEQKCTENAEETHAVCWASPWVRYKRLFGQPDILAFRIQYVISAQVTQKEYHTSSSENLNSVDEMYKRLLKDARTAETDVVTVFSAEQGLLIPALQGEAISTCARFRCIHRQQSWLY